MFNAEQYSYLLRPISDLRVHRDGKGKSHVQAYDVRARLIQSFGFGNFDIETIGIHLISATESGNKHTVLYRADVRLTVRDLDGKSCRYEDSATGDAINQPNIADAHDLAIKKALSQALKRCAVNLGDGFGLSLYNKNWQPGDASVRGTVVTPKAEGESTTSVPESETKVAPEEEEAEVGHVTDEQVANIVEKSNEVADLIARAESKGELAVAWKVMKAAESYGDLTSSAVEALVVKWQDRKEILIKEGKIE